jgi:hypothetical protein
MNIYLIQLLAANTSVGQRVASTYPDFYQYNETTFLVVDASPITENIAIGAGIKGDGRVEDASGFVLKLGNPPSYSGFTTRALWDWLGAAGSKTQ